MSEKQIGTSQQNRSGCIVKELRPAEAWDLVCRHQPKKQPDEVQADAHDLVILDVRTAQEFSMNHLKGSINLDFKSPSFAELVFGLDRKKAYLVYCRTGMRASRAVLLMSSLGFWEIYNLAGGISRWHGDGFEVILGDKEEGSDNGTK
jgi:rhodanese-related sulfurtransferase